MNTFASANKCLTTSQKAGTAIGSIIYQRLGCHVFSFTPIGYGRPRITNEQKPDIPFSFVVNGTHFI